MGRTAGTRDLRSFAKAAFGASARARMLLGVAVYPIALKDRAGVAPRRAPHRRRSCCHRRPPRAHAPWLPRERRRIRHRACSRQPRSSPVSAGGGAGRPGSRAPTVTCEPSPRAWRRPGAGGGRCPADKDRHGRRTPIERAPVFLSQWIAGRSWLAPLRHDESMQKGLMERKPCSRGA